ncbi:MAG: hypothetical protein MH472_02900 [Bacteroidia bacterium]|nr:hypothetical protein [Bacteroidia bacterium]
MKKMESNETTPVQNRIKNLEKELNELKLTVEQLKKPLHSLFRVKQTQTVNTKEDKIKLSLKKMLEKDSLKHKAKLGK